MAFFDDTIGNWTVAELQNYLQSVAQLEPTQLPPAISPAQADIADARIDSLRINSIIDLSSSVKFSKDGQTMHKGEILMSDFWGNVQPRHEVDFHMGAQLYLQGQARMMTMDPAYVSTDDSVNDLGPNRLDFYLAYMPLREKQVTQVGFYQTVQGDYTSSAYNGIGIYKLRDTTSGMIDKVAETGNDGTMWKNSSGHVVVDLADSADIDSGWYYFCVAQNWSASVTNPRILHKSTPAVNLQFTTLAQRSFRLTNSGSLADSYDITGATALSRTTWLYAK